MIKVRFKDPQLPPDQNVKEKYVNLQGNVFQAISAARDAFNIPEVVPIALLYKGRRLNPSNTLSSYGIEQNSMLMIVPDQIKGG
ncbi:MAG: ubiquitin-like protein [Candidatus Thorarchaeota archaeon]